MAQTFSQFANWFNQQRPASPLAQPVANANNTAQLPSGVVKVEASPQKPAWYAGNEPWLIVTDFKGGQQGMTKSRYDQLVEQGYFNPAMKPLAPVPAKPEGDYIFNSQTRQWQPRAEFMQSLAQMTPQQLAASQAAQPNLPAQGTLDVYNPGKWLADMLRGQKPGYVMNSRVPRPNQISQQSFQRMTPTQQQILAAYWSQLGIDPSDALSEMARWFYGNRPYQSVRHLA